jgi:small-conductance mechanosensitive channel
MPSRRRRRLQFIRAAAATLFALIGAVWSSFGDIHDPEVRLSEIAPAVAGAVLLLVAGSVVVRTTASAIRDRASEKVDEARAGSLAKTVATAGYVVVAMWTLSALDVGIQALLLGGALTGVVLGIAAQQTLGNIFAGGVLLVARPFTVGEDTVLKSSTGEFHGRVTNIGLFYVTILTEAGQVDVPNSVALASAVGPGAAQANDAETSASDSESSPPPPAEPSRS